MRTPAFDLQPMSAGDILDRALRLYRRHLLPTLRILSVVFLPILLIDVLEEVGSGGGGTHAGWSSLGGLLFVWLYSLGFAALARSTSEMYLGRTPGIWTSYGPVLRRSVSLTCLSLLGFLALAAMLFLTSTIVVGVATFSILVVATTSGIVFGLAVILGRTSLVFVVMAIESLEWRTALKRSWRLTSGSFWRVAAVWLFSFVVILGPSILISLASLLLGGWAPGPVIATARNLLLQLTSLILSPIGGIATVVVYYDCCIRREAFDLEVLAQRLGNPTGPA